MKIGQISDERNTNYKKLKNDKQSGQYKMIAIDR